MRISGGGGGRALGANLGEEGGEGGTAVMVGGQIHTRKKKGSGSTRIKKTGG